jgi:toxin HigB-1
VIIEFHCVETESFFKGGPPAAPWRSVANVAARKLDILDAATSLRDLKSVGNQLEKMKDDRAGQHSIRINDKWRVCFIWTEAGPTRVEIVDPH